MSTIDFINWNNFFKRFRFFKDGDQFMKLNKISNTTEKILDNIIFRSKKYGKWIDGKLWVDITQTYLSKLSNCSPRTVVNHVNMLIEKGILLKEQFNVKDCDKTNFYCVNPLAVENSNLMEFFSSSIVKKLHNIYNISNKSINKSNKSTIVKKCNFEIEKSKEVIRETDEELINNEIIERFSEEERKIYDSTKPTIVQDMMSIWREHINPDEKLTKETSRFLVACFYQKFDKSLKKWKEYVIGLKNSLWITKFREKWKSILKWALSFKVINRIFAGGFGVTLGEVLVVYPQSKSNSYHEPYNVYFKREFLTEREDHLSQEDLIANGYVGAKRVIALFKGCYRGASA
jgi:predicted transcriptional regulator